MVILDQRLQTSVATNSTVNSTEQSAVTGTATTTGTGTANSKLIKTLSVVIDGQELNDAMDAIGDLDVFEDDEEMVYEGYSDPVSVQVMSRNANLSTKMFRKRSDSVEKVSVPMNSAKMVPRNTMMLDIPDQLDLDDGIDDDEDYDEFEDEMTPKAQKKSKKALELLGLSPRPASPKVMQRESDVENDGLTFVVNSNVGKGKATPSSQHQRALSNSEVSDALSELPSRPMSSDAVTIKRIDISDALTSKLATMQRKSEFDPTIIRRLRYQNKIASMSLSVRALDLERRSSEPLSPRTLQSAFEAHKKAFGDDTEIDYAHYDDEAMFAEEPTSAASAGAAMVTLAELKPANPTVPTPASAPANAPRQKLRLSINAVSAPQNYSRGPSFFVNSEPSARSVADDVVMERPNHSKDVPSGDELMKGLSLLMRQGFYSRKSLNSAQQLRRYKKSTGEKYYE